MTKQHNREKQTAVLLSAQQKRKEQKREQVFRAIEEIQKSGKPLTFPNIAQVAGCSISYLYKWTELTEYIHDLQSQKTQKLNSLESKTPGHNSLKTLSEVFKQRIRELEDENRELKRQNENLRGHVAEIFELKSECERLRTQIKHLTTPESSSKVVSLNSVPKNPDNVALQNPSPEITHLITEMGIKIGVRLKQEIAKHEPEKVKLAISAFQQYRSHNSIENPGACLLAMIRDEALPNIPQKAITPVEDEFERWYRQAIESGFCQDVPKKYLPVQQGEILVRVSNDEFSSGYELLSWRIAKAKMELDEDSSIS
jgi:metal-responsive CopG/Arc/MetJ family transcriptional regulator